MSRPEYFEKYENAAFIGTATAYSRALSQLICRTRSPAICWWARR